MGRRRPARRDRARGQPDRAARPARRERSPRWRRPAPLASCCPAAAPSHRTSSTHGKTSSACRCARATARASSAGSSALRARRPDHDGTRAVVRATAARQGGPRPRRRRRRAAASAQIGEIVPARRVHGRLLGPAREDGRDAARRLAAHRRRRAASTRRATCSCAGRLSERLTVDGEHWYPRDVEEVLLGHPRSRDGGADRRARRRRRAPPAGVRHAAARSPTSTPPRSPRSSRDVGAARAAGSRGGGHRRAADDADRQDQQGRAARRMSPSDDRAGDRRGRRAASERQPARRGAGCLALRALRAPAARRGRSWSSACGCSSRTDSSASDQRAVPAAAAGGRLATASSTGIACSRSSRALAARRWSPSPAWRSRS